MSELAAAERLAATQSTFRVLIVDDDPDMVAFLGRLLLREGMKVDAEYDGQAALAHIAASPPDLVLLDVLMPGVSGFEVCRRLKADPATALIPIILVTALEDHASRVRGIDIGADDFLSKPVNQHELLARVHSLLRLKSFTNELENAETVLFSLARSIEAKDPYTGGHCERLSEYSVALAERIGLSDELRVALRRGGIVHDIGKVAIPDHILLKPGRLTDEEWKIMKQHPIVGEKICRPLKSFRLVTPIIRHHHEKLDGTGYPDGLKGDQIPITAQVLQTVDIYDAMITHRPYRKALAPEEVFAEMREEVKRGWWDGALVDELEALVTEAVLPMVGRGARKEP